MPLRTKSETMAKYRKRKDEYQSVTQPLQDTTRLVGQVGTAVIGTGVAIGAMGAMAGMAGGLMHH